MSKFKVGDRVRALAKCTDPYYSNEGYFRVGEEFTVKEVFPSQNTVSLVERSQSWDESRFELVEEVKPVCPSVPASTSFKVGDKVRRKAGDQKFCCWSRGDEVLTISKVLTTCGSKQEVRFEGVQHVWDGFRFELVEEAKPVTPAVPQLPGTPEGFRAVRIGTPAKGEWYVDVDGKALRSSGFMMAKCYTILEKIDQPALVESAKPEAPAAPARKVAPVFKVGDKVRLVDNTGYEKFPKGTVDTVVSVSRHGCAQDLDLLTFDGALEGHNGMFAYQFELVEEAKPEAPAQPKFKKGDKVRCIRSGYGFTKGKVYTLLNDFDSGKRLVFKDDDGDTRHRSWDTDHPEFELVTESPDDLVIQDRVPSRANVDFGWWINDGEEFDNFTPSLPKRWSVRVGLRDGLMHGYKHENYSDRLAVMCYRKDLPVLPTTEKVMLTEYVVWDSGGAKCIIWSSGDPTVETDTLYSWHHAHATGNTREVEVPIVKP